MKEYRRRNADFGEFLKVLRREGKPRYLPFYEHGYHPGFIARRMEVPFDKMPYGSPEYFRTYVDFWLGIGYDCIPLEVGPNIRLPEVEHAAGVVTVESDARACIRTWEEFEKFKWPEPDRFINFHYFDIVAGMLPDGIKIVGGVGGGPYEWLAMLMGVMGLSLAVLEEPELVEAICAKLGELYVAADHRIAAMDAVGTLRQGDDLGFKSSTFLSPDDLRHLIFPMYKRMVAEAHAVGKPFILHSCGNLAAVYDDIIACGFDAKHSFEDGIMPVGDFKRQFGARITPLGGLDVDVICRSDEATLRAYTRRHIEQCFEDGYWALGSGNSLTDYMPVENYMVVIEEGLKVTC
jgi:uroporphyrinogen decarboxylase